MLAGSLLITYLESLLDPTSYSAVKQFCTDPSTWSVLAMASTHEHLEHAEHAEHHSHNTFTQRVAVTMAIIAAVLAGISTAGHRKHNEVLQIQGESNRLRTEAAAAKVEQSDGYAWYQSKKNRQLQYQTSLLTNVSTRVISRQVAGGKLDPESEKDLKSVEKAMGDWTSKLKDYADPDSPDYLEKIRIKADEKGNEIDDLQTQAKVKASESEHAHHQADRLDLGHLLAEIGLVVCSVSVLTKRKVFWIVGMLCAAMALGVAGSSYLIENHAAHTETHASNGDHSPADHGVQKGKDKSGKGHDGEKPAKDNGGKDKDHGAEKPAKEKGGKEKEKAHGSDKPDAEKAKH